MLTAQCKQHELTCILTSF